MSYAFYMLLLAVFPLSAQVSGKKNVTVSETKVWHSGKNCRVHKVEAGQTLYAIAEAYQVKTEEIIAINPGVENGLKVNAELFIPVPVMKKGERKHVVEKKQTIYGISKSYGISPEALSSANPGIEKGLNEGQVLIIPESSENNSQTKSEIAENTGKELLETKTNSVTTIKEPLPQSNEIAINLFLPLYLTQNDSVLSRDSPLETDELYAKAIPSIEFYYGFKLACDSLSERGPEIRLRIYDVPADSLSAADFFVREKIEPATCWVGPFHASGAISAISRAKDTHTPVVLPLAQMPKLLLGNAHATKITPSLYTQLDEMTHQVISNFKDAGFVLVHNNLPKEKLMADIIKKRAASLFSNKDSLKEVIFINSGIKGLAWQLGKNRKNVVMVASNDQAFVTDFFNKLNSLDSELDITVIGMESWQSFDNLDVGMLQKYKLHIPSGSYIDYHDNAVQRFVTQYRKMAATEPSRFSFLGYDAGMYYVKHLAEKGPSFLQLQDKFPWKGISGSFNFYRTALESGFENKSVYMLKYTEYSLQKAF